MNSAQRYEAAVMALHSEPSERDKENQRAVRLRHLAYAKYCAAHPDATMKERAAFYLETIDAHPWIPFTPPT